MYKVIKRFRDLTNNHIYKVGDIYPIEGDKPEKKRIKELSTTKNKSGYVLIEEIKDVSKVDNDNDVQNDKVNDSIDSNNQDQQDEKVMNNSDADTSTDLSNKTEDK